MRPTTVQSVMIQPSLLRRRRRRIVHQPRVLNPTQTTRHHAQVAHSWQYECSDRGGSSGVIKARLGRCTGVRWWRRGWPPGCAALAEGSTGRSGRAHHQRDERHLFHHNLLWCFSRALLRSWPTLSSWFAVSAHSDSCAKLVSLHVRREQRALGHLINDSGTNESAARRESDR